MRICYVLLSPTFGMHQYTADLANRMAQAGHDVHLVTTTAYPRDRYTSAVTVHTPVNTTNTGFSIEGLRGGRGGTFERFNVSTFERSDVSTFKRFNVVHLTGPHLWNIAVLRELRRAGIPTVHTLHDLDPHPGTLYGPLLHLWNHQVLRLADRILVHGACYRQRLLKRGMAAGQVTSTPLLFLFLGHTWLGQVEHLAEDVSYEPLVLFFGRLKHYKGIAHLLTAWAMTNGTVDSRARLVLAGKGDLKRLWAGALPSGVDLRNRLIDDRESLELFRRCSLLVLPYLGATQSALIPAAYFFRKPVMAAPSGAFSEYVKDGETGWLIEPEHPPSLARCLAAALSDVERLAKMGAAGRAWYDERRVGEERTLIEMYETLATNGARI